MTTRQRQLAAGQSNYYFTCSYTAFHYDDYGPLPIAVEVQALDPDGNVLASELRGEGGGVLVLDVIAAVPLAFLSSRDYACRAFVIYPSSPELVAEGKIACEDERNDILREYGIHSVPTVPFCSDFTTSGGTTHFSWPDWTQDAGNHAGGWAIGKIWGQLEQWYSSYDRGGFRVTSGYRCPHRNFELPGAVQDSRHMSGEAIDVFSAEHEWTPEEHTRMRDAARQAGSTWQSDWGAYNDHHLHAQWR
ncbi:MAG: D-Ala-D-Ala carboxypeptidase family metallohydrolase [Acidobacteriota bacterium]